MTIHLMGFSLDTTKAEFYAKRHLHNAISQQKRKKKSHVSNSDLLFVTRKFLLSPLYFSLRKCTYAALNGICSNEKQAIWYMKLISDNNMEPDEIQIHKSLDLLIATVYKENAYILS